MLRKISSKSVNSHLNDEVRIYKEMTPNLNHHICFDKIKDEKKQKRERIKRLLNSIKHNSNKALNQQESLEALGINIKKVHKHLLTNNKSVPGLNKLTHTGKYSVVKAIKACKSINKLKEHIIKLKNATIFETQASELSQEKTKYND